jgi:hypothetical protein
MPRPEAVAAIIAGPGHHRHFASRRMARHDGSRHRGAGILHEDPAGRSGRDRPPVRLAHFVIGQQFEHVDTILHPISGSQ